MSLAVVHTRALVGIKAIPVEVEVLTSNGLPGISIVGLPEAAVRESKDRVRGALQNSGFKLPQQRITINLAPADLPKEGGRYDLSIAIGILIASNQIQLDIVKQYEFVGELALSGALRKVGGILPTVIAAQKDNRILVAPIKNKLEASIVPNAEVICANNLLEVSAHLSNIKLLPKVPKARFNQDYNSNHDLSDVKGQDKAKRALEIAAAGGHNILLVGPPGTGKTMLASRFISILPPLSITEAIETASIYSVSNTHFDIKDFLMRPMRSPHHSASAAALVGGGSIPKPGEISLAHNGVLFLDEFPEFDRKVLEVLREPMESGEIRISRAAQQIEFDADFLLIASMNPCPCGFLGDESGKCHCTVEQVLRYRNKISGPLLDRIDIHIEVPKVAIQTLQQQSSSEKTSKAIRKNVLRARDIQQQRLGKINYQLTGQEINKVCSLASAELSLLETAMERLNFSARSYHRILRLARTIADLDESSNICKNHLAEAISYRILDRSSIC